MKAYTKATERLKQLHRDYKGEKSGYSDKATFFINDHAFQAIHSYYDCNSIGYTELSEQEFIDLLELEPKRTDKPTHYSKGIDTFARMESNCTKEECLAFAKGNIDKYNWREKGQDIEDLDKIIAYANWAKKLLNKQI